MRFSYILSLFFFALLCFAAVHILEWLFLRNTYSFLNIHLLTLMRLLWMLLLTSRRTVSTIFWMLPLRSLRRLMMTLLTMERRKTILP